MIENRVLDLVVDSNIPFAYVLKFQDVTLGFNGEVAEEVDIDITGATFKGSIKTGLDASSTKITDFDAKVVTPKLGIASVSLSKEKVSLLEKAASTDRDKYNQRLRFVGFYDILMTMPNKQPVRILEGKVYINDGVTI
ncbi:tail protein [Providencia phage vB_PreS_PR1]|uniref:Tail protein n=1 Tax=Providencia phage vB_PreS_PR1 TaxID=1931407 RepID=A0A1S6KV33_9CAUD|nr:collar tail protein for L-shaped tail fibre attachment [Providencia phage vB_PreS_PR1]AQT25282.1 tail protein [Providencia phage vB_PreS_PR1]